MNKSKILSRDCPILCKKIYLRQLSQNDSRKLSGAANSYEVASQIGSDFTFPHPYTDEDAKRFIAAAASARAKGEEYHFGIFVRGSNALAGMVGLREIDKERHTAEIGYWLNPSFWGNNYAYEASREVLSFAFDKIGLNVVYATTFAFNKRSINLLRRLKFSAPEVAHGLFIHDSKIAHAISMSLTRFSWEAQFR